MTSIGGRGVFGMVVGTFLFGAAVGAVAQTPADLPPTPVQSASPVPAPAAAAPDPAAVPSAAQPPAATPAPATGVQEPHPVDSSGPVVRSIFDQEDMTPDHPVEDADPHVGSSFDRQDSVDEHPVP